MSDWDERYAALADYACRIAQGLTDAAPSDPARYIIEQGTLLRATHRDGGRERPSGPAADALDAIAQAWPDVDGFQFNWLLWHNLMSEWPMGHYAQMAADALSAVDGPLGTVVELGAGVGATTRRIQKVVAQRGGTVIATDRLFGPPAAVDFDQPLADQVPAADAVVATNALHCAADLAATLRWVRDVLRPGGVLVLGEGAPYPEPGVPWALNILFGVCRGWYDRPGFRAPETWTRLLADAGFDEVTRTPWPSERYELGGAIVAR